MITKNQEITFDKEKREIRINGVYAGFIDGSENMFYEAVHDPDGSVKVIVKERIVFHSPLPDGTAYHDCVIMIFRPYQSIEYEADKRRRERERKKEHQAARARYELPFKLIEVKENNGQAKMGEFL